MIMPKREKILNWYVQVQNEQQDCIFIPEGMENAFMGVVDGTTNPTIAVLDHDQVVENLIKQGFSLERAFAFVREKSENPTSYGPLICHRYPELHPKNLSKKDDCPF